MKEITQILHLPASFNSLRSSGGSEKSKCSSVAVIVSTSSKPRAASQSSKSLTKISGTEAPLETPTVLTPVSHSSFASAA
jgi:hypothetical protein